GVPANHLARERDEAAGRVYNVGTGRGTTILRMAEELAQQLEVAVQPDVPGRFRAGDVRHCIADLTRIRGELGYEPRVALEAGLKELLEGVRTPRAGGRGGPGAGGALGTGARGVRAPKRRLDAPRLDRLVESFARLRLLVIGDAMLDEYLWGDVERVSPEAPVPVVHGRREPVALGGAGNVLRNAAPMGRAPRA